MTTEPTHYLVACSEYPTAELAWENSEGLAYCKGCVEVEILRQSLREGCYFIPVPHGLRDSETGELIGIEVGQCEVCYEAWQTDQVEYWQDLEVERHVEYLDYRRQNLTSSLTGGN
jgi:hypothetical protein